MAVKKATERGLKIVEKGGTNDWKRKNEGEKKGACKLHVGGEKREEAHLLGEGAPRGGDRVHRIFCERRHGGAAGGGS